MRRRMAWILLLALLLALCACGKEEPKEAGATATEAQSRGAVDPATGAWLGRGGCYVTEPLELSEEPGHVLLGLHGGQALSQRVVALDDTRICLGEEELLRLDTIPLAAWCAEEGIWTQEEERSDEGEAVRLSLWSYGGEPLRSLRLPVPAGSFALGVAVGGDKIWLNCSNAVRVYDMDGALLCQIAHEEWKGHVIRGGDGTIYFLEPGQRGGGTLSALDTEAESMKELFRYEKGSLSTGDGESAFFLCLPDGIYRMDAAGQTRPLVLWDECLLSAGGVTKVEALDDGRFLLRGATGDPLLLVPAQPEDIRPRTVLTLCAIPSQQALDAGIDDVSMYYTNILRSVSAYNARGGESIVRFVDLSENGALTAQQALLKLNTQILSGEAPDMIVFEGGVSPFPFLRQGLLRDLREDLKLDPEISEEDLVLARAIENDCGGLYLMTECFSMETRLGLQSRFGDSWGWSLEDYYRIDAETPEGKMVIYNLTRDYFLRMSLSRCLRSAIDWQSGSCDFDNEGFVRVLEACRDIRETPEDPNNMVFGANLMADGYMVTELAMVGSVTDLAEETRRIGQPVSVIGWPTPDGSCGTDFGISYPIGVLQGGAHPALCWDFLRFCLLHAERGIPNYRPLMEQQIEQARHIDPEAERELWYDGLRSPMTEAEIGFFRELLEQVEHSTLCDETALTILREEIAPFLAGQRSAEETAKVIQSRMSIYISEQG